MNTLFENKYLNKASTHEWLTPPHIIQELGEFNLDPCSPIDRPWDTALNHYTIEDSGLFQEWNGRVWCNPPYGKNAIKWVAKCVNHGNAMLLIFARTETKVWHDMIWNNADAIFFFKGRLKFFDVNGKQGGSAGSPSVLVAFGKENVEALKNCDLNGKLIILNDVV